MNIQEIASAVQAGALTVAFLYLVWQAPNMLRSWIASKKELALIEEEKEVKVNKHWAEERSLDRQARHDANTKFQEILAEVILEHKQSSDKINETLSDLRVTMQSLCRYQLPMRPQPRQQGDKV